MRSDGKGKIVDGTDTFHVIRYEEISPARWKEVTCTPITCEVRPQNKDPNLTRITIMGNLIYYPGDTGTITAYLELVKLVINSVIS